MVDEDLYKLKPFEYDSIDAFQYCYIFKINLRFQPNVCDGCHDSIQKAMNFKDVARVSLKETDDRFIFCI